MVGGIQPWDGPNPQEYISLLKVAYTYDRNNAKSIATSKVNRALHKAIPQVEQLLKRATKVTYKLTNSSHKGYHLFYYVAPRFSTDYFVIEAKVNSPSDILLTMTWIPYEPGTRTVDFGNILTEKIRSKVDILAGAYLLHLTKMLARKMPHLEKVAQTFE